MQGVNETIPAMHRSARFATPTGCMPSELHAPPGILRHISGLAWRIPYDEKKNNFESTKSVLCCPPVQPRCDRPRQPTPNASSPSFFPSAIPARGPSLLQLGALFAFASNRLVTVGRPGRPIQEASKGALRSWKRYCYQPLDHETAFTFLFMSHFLRRHNNDRRRCPLLPGTCILYASQEKWPRRARVCMAQRPPKPLAYANLMHGGASGGVFCRTSYVCGQKSPSHERTQRQHQTTSQPTHTKQHERGNTQQMTSSIASRLRT